jgi:DNA-3-methyladenine glycosylase II
MSADTSPTWVGPAWEHLLADPLLGSFAAQIPCPEVTQSGDILGDIVSSVVSQQLSTKAAATIHGRFVALMPAGVSPEAILNLSLEEMRGGGLSRQKAACLRDLSERILDGRLDLDSLLEKDAEGVEAALTQVKGIGPWTAEMLLIFRLGHPDILPVADLGIQKGFKRVMGLAELPSKEVMISTAEPWRPYRTLASRLLWRVYDSMQSGDV